MVELITGSVFQCAFGIPWLSLPPTAVSLASGSSGRRGGFNCGYRTRRAFLPVSEPLLRWLRELALVILGAVHPSRLLLMAPLPPFPFIASLR